MRTAAATAATRRPARAAGRPGSDFPEGTDPVLRPDLTLDPDEPSAVDLAAIEAEWPLIEAEMALVDAEIHLLTVHGGPSTLDWRRLRRAEARVMREAVARSGRVPLSDLAA